MNALKWILIAPAAVFVSMFAIGYVIGARNQAKIDKKKWRRSMAMLDEKDAALKVWCATMREALEKATPVKGYPDWVLFPRRLRVTMEEGLDGLEEVL